MGGEIQVGRLLLCPLLNFQEYELRTSILTCTLGDISPLLIISSVLEEDGTRIHRLPSRDCYVISWQGLECLTIKSHIHLCLEIFERRPVCDTLTSSSSSS